MVKSSLPETVDARKAVLTRAESAWTHARKCKSAKKYDACKVCEANTQFFSDLSLPMLAYVLAERPRASRGVSNARKALPKAA